jgi:hypothetical protein
MLTRRSAIHLIAGAAVGAGWKRDGLAETLTPQRAVPIAKEAFIFGYPMVVGYGAMFASAVDKDNPQYKAPFNEIHHEARVCSPQDTSISKPNCDTSYSTLWADLRVEPLVLEVPAVPKNRYYSIQFVDLYTWNFVYAGTRTTGNEAGRFLLTGPSWKGVVPKGVGRIIRAETDFVFAIYRIQIFNSADIGNVEKIQPGYTVRSLSSYLGKAAPSPAPEVDFPAFSPEKAKSLEFFNYLSFLLQFCPVQPADQGTRERLAGIGIESGKPFNPEAFWSEMRSAIEIGMRQGLKAIEANVAATEGTGDLFGARRAMKNSYLNRATGAMVGVYGSSKLDAVSFRFDKDIANKSLDGATSRYTIHFEKGQLPPVKGFWSLTLYDQKSKLLSANALNRYLINSSMLPGMARSADGGLTIYIQKDPPGKGLENNWLPAPDGLFLLQFRCYWPDGPIVNGKWAPPAPVGVV